MFQNAYMQLFLTFIHQVWSFGQVWTEDLLREVTAICWRITLSFQRATTYAPLSHQLSVHLTHCSCAVCVVCWHENQSREGDKAGGRRWEKGKKVREEKRAIMHMWLNDVAVPWATVTSALSFIYYHTTAESLYILIDCKTQTHIHTDHGHDL